MFLLREDDVEDSVGAAAGLVHVGGSHGSEKERLKKKFNSQDSICFAAVPLKLP